MIETYLKKNYQRCLVKPLAKRLPTTITPNMITILGALFGVMSGLAIVLHLPIIAVVLLILSGYADTLDGCFAEVSQQQSNFGSILDIVADRIVESAIVLGLYFYQMSTARAVLCLLLFTSILICITSFLIVSLFTTESKLKTQGKSFYYSIGLMERAEAFLFFGLMILLPQYFTVLAIAFIVLVGLTAGLHLWQFRLFESKKTKSC